MGLMADSSGLDQFEFLCLMKFELVASCMASEELGSQRSCQDSWDCRGGIAECRDRHVSFAGSMVFCQRLQYA